MNRLPMPFHRNPRPANSGSRSISKYLPHVGKKQDRKLLAQLAK